MNDDTGAESAGFRAPEARDAGRTHQSLRNWVAGLIGHRQHPGFEPSDDPTLAAFAELFAQSQLFALRATKQQRIDALTLVYDCWTESTRTPGSDLEMFVVAWAPNRQGRDPLTGFRTGEDSILFGASPVVAMPQDERTDALLLLVTSRFVHLSAQATSPIPTVRGIVDTDGDGYRYLTYRSSGGREAADQTGRRIDRS